MADYRSRARQTVPSAEHIVRGARSALGCRRSTTNEFGHRRECSVASNGAISSFVSSSPETGYAAALESGEIVDVG